MFKKLLSLFFVLALCFTSSLSFADITTSLELHNQFENNYTDSSLRSRDYQVIGTTGNITYTGGAIGSGIYLNSTVGLKLMVGDFLPTLSSGFTISYWTLKNNGVHLGIGKTSYFDVNAVNFSNKNNGNNPVEMKRVGINSKQVIANINTSYYSGASTTNGWVLNTLTLSSDKYTWKLYRNGSLYQSGTLSANHEVTDGRLHIASQCFNTACTSSDYLGYPSYVDDLRVYSRELNSTDVAQLYTYSPQVDGLCGYALGFTGSFNTGDACLLGTISGLTVATGDFDLYTYSCLGEGGGTNDSCITAQQMTGYCGSLQGLTIYGDISERFDKNYCSGGTNGTTDFMTGLQFDGVSYDWYCDGPTGFGPQSYCSAFPYDVTVPLCGPANLNTFTFASGSNLTGSYICTSGEPGFFQFRENYGWLRECQLQNGLLPAVNCNAYLSGGLGYITPSYTGDNPFEAINYIYSGLNNTGGLSVESIAVLNFLRHKFSWFDEFWTIFTTYFSFVPQSTQVSIQLPRVGPNATLGIDSVVDSGVSMNDFFAYWGCDEYEVYCYYTTHLGIEHKILQNPFRVFLKYFLPVFFALLYVTSLLLLMGLLVFLPIYFLIPALSRFVNYLFNFSKISTPGMLSNLVWLGFSVTIFTLSFGLLSYYLSYLSGFIDLVKGVLWYVFSFILVNFIYTSPSVFTQAVIYINFSFFTIVITLIAYIAARNFGFRF